MKINRTVPPPSDHYSERRTGSLTEKLRKMVHGDSIWVETTSQRSTVRKLLWKMNKSGEINLSVVSRKVDESDPEGCGYRIWVLDQKLESKE